MQGIATNQNEAKSENAEKKMNRASVSCWMTS